jgi:hypothetical protein
VTVLEESDFDSGDISIQWAERLRTSSARSSIAGSVDTSSGDSY